MSRVSTDYGLPAIKSNGHLASDAETDCQTDNELSDWFGKLARPLLAGSDAGFALHLVTGFQPGTCARYVSKSPSSRRQPPGWFIVSLLRSEQGEIWETAFMDSSEARWWARHLRAQRIYETLKAELGE